MPVRCWHRHRQRGLSLVELMIAMTLGMGVALAALALLNAARSSQVAVNEGALVQDTGRYALDVLARAVRQANYVPHDHPVSAALLSLDMQQLSPGISGLDNSRLNGQTAALIAAQPNTDQHGSDVLAIRFFGSGAHGKADGSMLNCAGFAIAAPVTAKTIADAEGQRGWSMFDVAADSTGEPELRCKYFTKNAGWNAVAIARGVEAFQVLYGIGDTVDGPVTQYRNAARMSAQQWKQVIAVRIALLVRGEQNSVDSVATVDEASGTGYALFGPDYQNSLDPGTTIREVQQPHRMRKLYQTSIRLRNAAP